MSTRLLRGGVAAAAAALLALAGCGGGGGNGSGSAPAPQLNLTGEKSGKLTIVTKFADPQYAPYFVEITKAYQAANPKVTIDLQQVGDQPYKDKIRVLSAANQLPDIYFSWAGDFANKFVRAGLAADLSSVIGPDTAWGKTFAPASLKAFSDSGKYYGMPIDLDGKYLVYNKTAFAKAGIDNPPATFEDLLTDCGKLKAAGYTPIAFGNQYGWPAIHFITQLNAYDVPGDQLAKDYNPKTGAFTDQRYVTALQQFKSLADTCSNSGANGLAHEAAQANLVSGKAAMQYMESLEFKVMTVAGGAPKETADNWSFMRLPPSSSAAGDTKALTGAPDGFMVNAKSKQAALAVDFLKFFSNQENASKMVKELGWLSPVSGSVTNDNAFPQLVDTLKDMNEASQFAIWLDTVTQATVADAYLSGVEGMLSGDKTPEQVMKGVQDAAAKAKKQVG
ncbi:extracellular solute-binding protein [Planosporangium thailandense]|uniref:Extracellular solute-binding protein n=1 Tax=Planosporangium thailandense TaxID=765197 RepID=A0ABX0XZE1_9ACTN|nr:extracellular solute-binding protein [Planosporangium thailandense]NJC70720.1 extracellular solute-binding protein [Planosporangium thailandense]